MKPKKIKQIQQTEQVSQAELEGWEDQDPNVNYEIVDGQLVEVPVIKSKTPRR